MEQSPNPQGHTRRRSGSLLFNNMTSKHPTSRGQRQAPGDNGKSIPEGSEGLYGSETSGGTTSDDMEMDEMHSDDELDDDEETGLTHTERKKKRRRKSKNQRLDQRVVPGEDFQKAEERLVNANLVKNIVINSVLIGLWYGFSIAISVYNKWMFSDNNLNFPFPLFTTSIHMLVQFLLASLVLCFLPRFRPGRDGTTEDTHGIYSQLNNTAETREDPNSKPPIMTKTFYLTRIAPCGTATALDIGLGNFSLRFITLTFFTMCKSSVLAFVLLFAFLFRLEKPTWALCAIIGLMSIGVILMVSGEAAFNALGFILVMSASFCSGFRWSLTQILLLRNPATSNPFSSIFFLTPVMFLALFILALPIEGPTRVIAGFATLAESKGTFLGIVIMLFPGCLAFMMVAAEFALLKRTSVVTLSVCGIFKEVLTISAASLTFGDTMSPINISGLVVTILSIAAYNWLKYGKMKGEAKREAHEIMDESGDIAPKGKSVLADPDDFAIGRDSTETAGLMRDSLALATSVEPGGNHGAANGIIHGTSHSPTKRPEDLE